MEETISLKELMQTLRKRMGMIIFITLLAVIASGVVSYFVITPVYQASTQILINQSSKTDQSVYNPNEVQTNLQLINTYNVIIKSPAILDKVSQQLNSGLTADQINKKITVSNETNSQVVTLAVEDPNPYTAAKIANTVATVFQENIKTIMNVDNVSILSKASVATNQAPVKPRPLMNIAIALVVGLMAGIGLAFLLEYLDNTVKNEQDIEKLLELPVLGVIGSIEDQQEPKAARKSVGRGESLGV
ncbi:YveK family protein [Heyndrickxia acidicola]|uniref:Wzz/FepE/Etk N-terminal domain-containing protein n=1 Tax=Heyndrickxia acidicola TaxID=209389 RepID=A0ABU6MNT9_9BACI|nr:Wzz/FepE/Etk N-terminal domain-containing protein [Heyndrickxia acidicola]MED1204705.1 Wzz/FepE/Etk N-terminal domain-containing protein [Heyndrickxia acidicola]